MSKDDTASTKVDRPRKARLLSVVVKAKSATEADRIASSEFAKNQPPDLSKTALSLPGAIERRISAIRQQQISELQLKLFPDWPDGRRGAPNTVIRSAIFGVVPRGRRQRVSDLPVAAERLEHHDDRLGASTSTTSTYGSKCITSHATPSREKKFASPCTTCCAELAARKSSAGTATLG